jgi:hypothetical protein
MKFYESFIQTMVHFSPYRSCLQAPEDRFSVYTLNLRLLTRHTNVCQPYSFDQQLIVYLLIRILALCYEFLLILIPFSIVQ